MKEALCIIFSVILRVHLHKSQRLPYLEFSCLKPLEGKVFSAAETGVFTYGRRLDYNSKRRSNNEHPRWKYDPNFCYTSCALKS